MKIPGEILGEHFLGNRVSSCQVAIHLTLFLNFYYKVNL